MPKCHVERGVYLVAFTQEEIGQGVCEDVEHCLREALDRLPAGTQTILLDLEGIRFLRSSGLGAMLSICEEVRPRGIRVAVCRVPAFGRNLFKISRLDEHLSIFPDAQAALAALGEPGSTAGPAA